MRVVSTACGIVLLLATGITFGQTPPSQKAAPPAAVAPQAGKYNVNTTRMGVLLDDPASRAVLEKYIPKLIDSPDVQNATAMTLKDMQQALQAYAPDLLSDKVLAQIQADFDELPPKKPANQK
jgi:hypothetical protein